MGIYTGEIASTACAVLWALALVLFAGAGRSLPPLSLNLLKNTVALAFMAPTLVLFGESLAPRWDAYTTGIVAISGIAGITVSDSLLFAGLNRLGPGWTAVVSCTYTPLMIGTTAIGFGIPVTPSVAVGALLVTAALLVLAGRFHDPHPRRQRLTGLGFGILAHLVNVLAVVILKYPLSGHVPIFEQVSVLQVTFWRLMWGAAMLTLWKLVAEGLRGFVRTFRPTATWRWMVPAAFLGSYLAMIIWIAGMKEITGSLARAAILNQTSTIFIPIFGALVLGESVTPRKVLAIVMAFTGASIVVLAR